MKKIQIITSKKNQQDKKDNDKVTQEDLEKPDIEWGWAQGKSVNVPYGGKQRLRLKISKLFQKETDLGMLPVLLSVEGNGKETGNDGEELAIDKDTMWGHLVFLSFGDTKQQQSNITIMEQRSSLLFFDKRKQRYEIGHTWHVFFFSFGNSEQEFENRKQF